MIVSPDYKFLRVSTWEVQPSGRTPSDAMKEKHPEKRSWWVNPAGMIYDSGHDHNAFLEKHKKLFGGWTDIDGALVQHWVRVAFFNGEYVVHCHGIMRMQIRACQKIYKDLGGEHKIFISTLNKNGYISPHDFIWAESQADLIRNLFKDPTGIRAARRMANEPDRAWFVSPKGEILSCGRDHTDCVRRKMDILQDMGYTNIRDNDDLLDGGWAKIGRAGPSHADFLYIECKRMSPKYFSILHDMAMQQSTQTVSVREEGSNLVDLDRKEFLELSNLFDLRRRLRIGRRLAFKYEGRAWLVSPQGQIVSCGWNHDGCVDRESDAFEDMGYKDLRFYEDLLDDGWAKIGRTGLFLSIECGRLLPKYLDILQEIAGQTSTTSVSIKEGNRVVDLGRQEFLALANITDLRRRMRFGRRKISSLPKSRNFLMGVDLESMSWPLRKAFDLLDLTKKKDKLSANQVAAVFQDNDTFLQDHLGRTATELITDLNSFFQYGPAQEQIA